MNKTDCIQDRVAALTLRREEIKLALFEKETQKLKNKERFVRFNEPTPIEERVTLDADIACLEEDRQRTKIQLMRLKMEAKELRATTLIQLLIEALAKNGCREEIKEAHRLATDAVKHSGLFAAYESTV